MAAIFKILSESDKFVTENKIRELYKKQQLWFILKYLGFISVF